MRSDLLHVIAVISNPSRFKRRAELYNDFAKRVANAGAVLHTVEIAFGDRPFEVTTLENPRHLQLRTFDELWHKENMINLGIAHLCETDPDWQYVAWVDADISFARPDWAVETVHQLQHHMVVQMFRTAHDLGPSNEIISAHTGFAYSYVNGLITGTRASDYCSRWHPGFAWAARREAIDHLGGLLDFAILGAADKHMAMALIGKVDCDLSTRKTWHPSYISPTYLGQLLQWQTRAERYIRRDLGYVDGSVLHHWHGKKADRKYVERWKVLIEENYRPDVDLKRDSQGLYQLVDHGDLRSIRLRDKIRAYFRQRNEDSIDLA
jgi:hypothetical protein